MTRPWASLWSSTAPCKNSTESAGIATLKSPIVRTSSVNAAVRNSSKLRSTGNPPGADAMARRGPTNLRQPQMRAVLSSSRAPLSVISTIVSAGADSAASARTFHVIVLTHAHRLPSSYAAVDSYLFCPKDPSEYVARFTTESAAVSSLIELSRSTPQCRPVAVGPRRLAAHVGWVPMGCSCAANGTMPDEVR